nr:MAG TPA: hypothetical protein [Caudoviricetes sp.]DAO80642.1 MAG TPA: hypothetical protein [Caudoviricetes sp.]
MNIYPIHDVYGIYALFSTFLFLGVHQMSNKSTTKMLNEY